MQTGMDCGGTFLPNNSRHSVGLYLSLQLYNTALDATVVAHLQAPWLWFCFHEFWNKVLAHVASTHWQHLPSAAHSWCHRQQKQWVSVEPLHGFPHVLHGPSNCQSFHRSCTTMSMRLLSCQTWLKLLNSYPDGLRQSDQQVLRLCDCIGCLFLRNQVKIELSDTKLIFVVT